MTSDAARFRFFPLRPWPPDAGVPSAPPGTLLDAFPAPCGVGCLPGALESSVSLGELATEVPGLSIGRGSELSVSLALSVSNSHRDDKHPSDSSGGPECPQKLESSSCSYEGTVVSWECHAVRFPGVKSSLDMLGSCCWRERDIIRSCMQAGMARNCLWMSQSCNSQSDSAMQSGRKQPATPSSKWPPMARTNSVDAGALLGANVISSGIDGYRDPSEGKEREKGAKARSDGCV